MSFPFILNIIIGGLFLFCLMGSVVSAVYSLFLVNGTNALDNGDPELKKKYIRKAGITIIIAVILTLLSAILMLSKFLIR